MSKGKGRGDDELKARAVGGEGDGGEVVDLSRIEADIRHAREAIAANRREIEDLKQGRLSVQSLEVLLTDISDIWTNTGQLVGLERQQRDELRVIAGAQRDLVDELRAVRAMIEARNAGRERWRSLLRRRRDDPGGH